MNFFRWKAKVKQLERDLDRSKHGAAQVIQRNEQLVKEMEQQKHHGGYAQMQLDNMKRELQDALVRNLIKYTRLYLYLVFQEKRKNRT